MENTYKTRIKEIVLEYLENEEVEVAMFGSRALSRERVGSDIDIAIIPKNGWNEIKLSQLREHLENSTIPWKVDLVDFSHVNETFKRQVLANAEIWKK